MAAKAKTPNLATITKHTKPKREVVEVCVAGDLITQHQRLTRQLDEMLETRASRKLSEQPDPEVEQLVERIHKLEDQIRDRTYDFEFEKIDNWLDLMDEHPPRKGKERRERWNPNTFPQAAVRASCVSPEGMDDDETFEAFWAALNDGQRDALWHGAQAANEVALSVPFSASASAHRLTSEPSSTTAPEPESP